MDSVCKVKIADLRHNSDLTRLPGEPTKRDSERLAKYREAHELREAPERREGW